MCRHVHGMCMACAWHLCRARQWLGTGEKRSVRPPWASVMSNPRSVPPVACIAVGTSRHASEASGFVPVDVRGHVHVRGVHAYVRVRSARRGTYTHMYVHVSMSMSACACARLEVRVHAEWSGGVYDRASRSVLRRGERRVGTAQAAASAAASVRVGAGQGEGRGWIGLGGCASGERGRGKGRGRARGRGWCVCTCVRALAVGLERVCCRQEGVRVGLHQVHLGAAHTTHLIHVHVQMQVHVQRICLASTRTEPCGILWTGSVGRSVHGWSAPLAR